MIFNHCLACGSGDLLPVLDLGNQPLANDFKLERKTAMPWTGWELKTKFCRVCSHVQLSSVPPKEMLFVEYLYVSGTTETLRNYFKKFVEEEISPGETVLDIGCNDGSLMRAIIEGKAFAWGVDPASTLKKEQEGLDVYHQFWVQDSLDLPQQFDKVTALNVLGHTDDPHGFLKKAKDHLEPRGVIIVEMPYAPKSFKEGQFDQVYHEHVSYFCVNSMNELAKNVGLELIKVQETPVHGGSMRYYLAKPLLKQGCSHISVASYCYSEKEYSKYTFHKNFATLSHKTIDLVEKVIQRWDEGGYEVVVYGASAKFSVLSNAFKDPADCPIKLVVDDNPKKHGRYTPGLQIPIAGPGALAGIDKSLLVLCGSPNFKPEIERRLKQLGRGKGDYMLTWWGGGNIEQIGG